MKPDDTAELNFDVTFRVTSDLTSRLETERYTYEKQIKKLHLEVETARNEPEIEARYLREKLRRLKAETKPIVEIYKVSLYRVG